MANILYRKQKQQKSLDNGATWVDTGEYRVGDILENPSNCSGEDSKQCRWVELDASEGYYCDGVSKYTVQVEECTENGIIWTRTGNQKRGNTYLGDSMNCLSYSGVCDAVSLRSSEGDTCYYNDIPIYEGEEKITRYSDDFITDTVKDYRTFELYNTSCVTGMNLNLNSVIYTNLSDVDMSNIQYFRLNAPLLLGELNLSNWGGLLSNENNSNQRIMITCPHLNKLIINNFSHPKLYKLSDAFSGCSLLQTFDVSGIDTTNITNFNSIFYNCTSLHKIIGIETFVKKGANMSNMFNGCSMLSGYLDLSNWVTDENTVFVSMLDGCSNLISVNLKGWNVTNNNNNLGFFKDCSSLKELDLSEWDLSGWEEYQYKTNTGYVPLSLERIIVTNCNDRTKEIIREFLSYNLAEEQVVLVENESLIYTDNIVFKEDTNTNIIFKEKTDDNIDYSSSININGVNFCIKGEWSDGIGTFAFDIPVDYIYNISFASDLYTNLIEIVSMPSLDNVISYSSMFLGYKYLEIINLSNLTTSNVINMSNMFSGCQYLKNIINLGNFDTSKVTDMTNMFKNCWHLTSLDLSSFDTFNVTDMSYMFSSCNALTSLDLSSFDTSNVSNMQNMFYGCSGLTSLDLSNINGINVSNMQNMFYNCSGLTSLNLSNFSYDNKQNIKYLVNGCSSLQELNLTNFNIDSYLRGYYTYNGSNYTLSSSNLNIFNNCTSLNKLILGSISQSAYDWWSARLTEAGISPTIEYTIV